MRLLPAVDVTQYYCHSSIFIGSFLYQRTKPPQGTVLFINLLGKGLTPKTFMGDPSDGLLVHFNMKTGKFCTKQGAEWSNYHHEKIANLMSLYERREHLCITLFNQVIKSDGQHKLAGLLPARNDTRYSLRNPGQPRVNPTP